MAVSKTFVHDELLSAADTNMYLVNPESRVGANVAIASGSGGINIAVAYAQPFPAGAVTSVQLTVSHPNITHWRVISKSETGFTARFDRSGAASGITFDWRSDVVTQ